MRPLHRPVCRLIRLAPLSLLLLASCIGPPLVIAPTSLPDGAVGTTYSSTLTSDGVPPVMWQLTTGSVPPGLTLNQRTGEVAGTPTRAGTYDFTVQGVDSQLFVRAASQSYSVTILEELVIGGTLDEARVGVAYSGRPNVSGGVEPYRYTIVGLPAGLSFDTNTGEIFGTPSLDDDKELEIRVSDSGSPRQTRSRRVTLIIRPQPIEITTTALADGGVGESYSQVIQTLGGAAPRRFSIVDGLLPDGLSLNQATGLISGTPTQNGSFTFTIRVRDGDPSTTTDDAEFTLVIRALPVAIATTSLPDGRVGQAYSATLVATNGQSPLMWEITEGALPLGVSINATTGQIAGTPAQIESTTFTVRVTDSGDPATNATREFTIAIQQ
ncbi:putative Ig domain protein [Phycisphaerae bacterium RAS1]|nr:putative Ig domain protein [Phycisphaerae bacterium RAS1]